MLAARDDEMMPAGCLECACRANHSASGKVQVTMPTVCTNGGEEKYNAHVSRLNDAVLAENTKKIRNIVAGKGLFNSPVPVNSWNDDGFLPIHYCAEHGKVESLRTLVDLKANLDTKTSTGESVLAIACMHGRANIVKYLVEQRVDVTAKLTSNDTTALHLASSQGHVGVVRFLLSSVVNFDPNVQAKDGSTPLHYAAQNGRELVTQALTQCRGDVNRTRVSDGVNPIHLAAQNGHVWVCQYLLAGQANLRSVDKEGSSALLYAALNGHPMVVQWLLGHGIDVNDLNAMRVTALYCAAEGGHLECVKLLCQNKADPNLTPQSGETPIRAAARQRHINVEAFLDSWVGASKSDWRTTGHVDFTQEYLEQSKPKKQETVVLTTLAPIQRRALVPMSGGLSSAGVIHNVSRQNPSSDPTPSQPFGHDIATIPAPWAASYDEMSAAAKRPSGPAAGSAPLPPVGGIVGLEQIDTGVAPGSRAGSVSNRPPRAGGRGRGAGGRKPAASSGKCTPASGLATPATSAGGRRALAVVP